MKKLFLTGISLLFAATLTFAQEVKPEEKAKQETVTLTEKLTLTEDQQKTVFDLVLQGETAKATLRADATLSPEACVEALTKVQANVDTQVAEKLSDEQREIFAKIVSERPKEEAPAAPAQTEEQEQQQEESSTL
ncbi:hypothetical protein [Sphingobacterium psychroaquaticum]|uniref:Uncharacterized protein n=1 Tax=Sphingobacterium psychroaquaticum TaxID=561061 RepID=A0A1X7KBD2_9SPHI|nr:hypothetical protein [Sphingobacterium psychroaquaticum]QBQ39634.1 hypothetical protein E2P86_00010 [Sphingobacterium psychroaquaticum]SMG38194.1 hypothetical protein SAMN05660862_2678 [Sphingobacterium psychroaquaticum]